MRFKLDENLGAAAAHTFRSAGHDVSTIVEQEMSGATDPMVYAICVAEQRVLVTCDLDFANPFVFDPRPTAGIVVFRLPHPHGPADITDAINRFLAATIGREISTALWIVTPTRIRRFVQPESGPEHN